MRRAVPLDIQPSTSSTQTPTTTRTQQPTLASIIVPQQQPTSSSRQPTVNEIFLYEIQIISFIPISYRAELLSHHGSQVLDLARRTVQIIQPPSASSSQGSQITSRPQQQPTLAPTTVPQQQPLSTPQRPTTSRPQQPTLAPTTVSQQQPASSIRSGVYRRRHFEFIGDIIREDAPGTGDCLFWLVAFEFSFLT